jgi:hypothetical protein
VSSAWFAVAAAGLAGALVLAVAALAAVAALRALRRAERRLRRSADHLDRVAALLDGRLPSPDLEVVDGARPLWAVEAAGSRSRGPDGGGTRGARPGQGRAARRGRRPGPGSLGRPDGAAGG